MVTCHYCYRTSCRRLGSFFERRRTRTDAKTRSVCRRCHLRTKRQGSSVSVQTPKRPITTWSDSDAFKNPIYTKTPGGAGPQPSNTPKKRTTTMTGEVTQKSQVPSGMIIGIRGEYNGRKSASLMVRKFILEEVVSQILSYPIKRQAGNTAVSPMMPKKINTVL